MINALIIDDEPLSREIIREFATVHPDLKIMAECQDAHEAVRAIEKYHPDLLFLDIQMPEINGFELLTMLDAIPYVIFCTAYDEYALRAFEVNAVDYLLKPIVQDRFDQAVERVRGQFKKNIFETERIDKLLQNLQPQQKYLDRLLVKDSGKIILLRVDEIQWVEAAEDYVNLHTDQGNFLVLQSMSSLGKKLDPQKFVRIHRSYIINLEVIVQMVPWSNGRMKCTMKDGKEIVLSRAGSRKMKELMI